MRDILISAAVCVTCLLVALVSQLVAPSTVGAAPPATEIVRPAVAAQAPSTLAEAAVAAPLELDVLLARADAALYRAKALGRDRVCTPLIVNPPAVAGSGEGTPS